MEGHDVLVSLFHDIPEKRWTGLAWEVYKTLLPPCFKRSIRGMVSHIEREHLILNPEMKSFWAMAVLTDIEHNLLSWPLKLLCNTLRHLPPVLRKHQNIRTLFQQRLWQMYHHIDSCMLLLSWPEICSKYQKQHREFKNRIQGHVFYDAAWRIMSREDLACLDHSLYLFEPQAISWSKARQSVEKRNSLKHWLEIFQGHVDRLSCTPTAGITALTSMIHQQTFVSSDKTRSIRQVIRHMVILWQRISPESDLVSWFELLVDLLQKDPHNHTLHVFLAEIVLPALLQVLPNPVHEPFYVQRYPIVKLLIHLPYDRVAQQLLPYEHQVVLLRQIYDSLLVQKPHLKTLSVGLGGWFLQDTVSASAFFTTLTTWARQRMRKPETQSPLIWVFDDPTCCQHPIQRPFVMAQGEREGPPVAWLQKAQEIPLLQLPGTHVVNRLCTSPPATKKRKTWDTWYSNYSS
jgi:hypothetical protein